MGVLSYKVKVTALWLVEIVAFIVYRQFALDQNAYNASLLLEDELVGYLTVLAIFTVLTLILKERVSSFINFVAAIVMGIIQIIMFVDGFAEYSVTTFNLITVGTIISTTAILWFSRERKILAKKSLSSKK